MSIRQILSSRVQDAMINAGIPEDCSPAIAESNKPQFGDYQANGAMGAAKRMKTNPRALAEEVLKHLDLTDVADKVEIAGPGFLNIHLKNEWLGSQLDTELSGDSVGIQKAESPDTVVIDYSSPNLAKEMHVGHLRSSIIGDSLVRVLELLGHNVIRQNHVGDWGTQFGMLIAHLEDESAKGTELADTALSDLEAFYRDSKKRFDDEPDFADRARDYVVRLQSGDEHCRTLWQQFIDISLKHSEDIYQKLNVTLSREDVRAESAYNDDLAQIIDDLKAQGLAQESEGALVVFLEELADKKGNPSPIIVQKTGGGFLYATTDLAAAKYRSQTLGADRVLYFIDARQGLHMKQVFTLSHKAGFVSDDISLEHHAFGTMLGEDGKPFKTRSGGTVKLEELLDEAVERAQQQILERNQDLPADESKEIARKVGIGAVKYADLCKTRTNDYIFNWDSMLNFEGNTAPYLQYAYARIQRIFRKAEVSPKDLTGNFNISCKEEKFLALELLKFEETVRQVAEDAYPHVLCSYLFDLASGLMSFYEACPILKDGVDQATRDSRLLLCDAIARTLKQGLDLLGIEVMDRM
ncbi:arginine--tRNA ligase [Gammaproteobacteria bacterium 45_16_T64]|nr:arginine--tRNA ligase [Gammaproteobacteria bacterium 45_16_T64]